LKLEPTGLPVLARLVEAQAGFHPVYAEENPSAENGGAERFLAQVAAREADRKRHRSQEAERDEAFLAAAELRVQELRDTQRIARESIQRALTVAELLRRTTWGPDDAEAESACFLRLQPSVAAHVEEDEAAELQKWAQPATETRAAELRGLKSLAGTSQQQHENLFSVLSFLKRQHWLLKQPLNGSFPVELWKDSHPQSNKDAAQKSALPTTKGEAKEPGHSAYLAFVFQQPKVGVSVLFPPDCADVVERRHQLQVEVCPTDASLLHTLSATQTAFQESLQDLTLEDSDDRGVLIHRMLVEARTTLMDRDIFQHMRAGVQAGVWEVLVANTTCLKIMAPRLKVCVTFKYGPHSQLADLNGGIWEGISQLALLHLRELMLKRSRERTAITATLFQEFAEWANLQFGEALRYMRTLAKAVHQAPATSSQREDLQKGKADKSKHATESVPRMKQQEARGSSLFTHYVYTAAGVVWWCEAEPNEYASHGSPQVGRHVSIAELDRLLDGHLPLSVLLEKGYLWSPAERDNKRRRRPAWRRGIMSSEAIALADD